MQKKLWCFLVLVLIAFASGAQTADPPEISVAPLENRSPGGGSSPYGPTLTTMVKAAFQAKGFALIDGPSDGKGDFLFRGFYVVEGEDLIFQGTVEHLGTKRIVASDMASVFSGLTALDLIREMVSRLVEVTLAYHQKSATAPGTAIPLPEPLIFLGPEGTRVSWAGGESIGQVVGGRLEAPYYPFPSDGELVLRVEKEGFHPRNYVLKLTAESREIPLPELTPLVRQELQVSTALGRLLGAGVAYRYYWEPNNLYSTAEAHIYLQNPGYPQALTQIHTDFWFGGGYYLFSPPEADFRFSYELLLGFLITPQFQEKSARTAVDMVLMPLGLGLEYRGLREWPIQLGVRFPYSLGLPGGLLSRSWIFVASSLPVLSLGVSKRW